MIFLYPPASCHGRGLGEWPPLLDPSKALLLPCAGSRRLPSPAQIPIIDQSLCSSTLTATLTHDRFARVLARKPIFLVKACYKYMSVQWDNTFMRLIYTRGDRD